MQTIWKTVLDPANTQCLEVPRGSEFLCAREQGDSICVWYRCDDKAPMERRTIATAGTGHAAPSGRYLGTASLHGGALMFHVFELSQSAN